MFSRQQLAFVLFFSLGLALVPVISHAQVMGSPLIDGDLQTMQEISQGWDKLFQDTFFTNNGGSIWAGIRLIAQLVLALASLVFIYRLLMNLASGADVRTFIGPIVVLLFCVYLLGGNAQPAVKMAYGAVQIKDSVRDTIMRQSIADVRFGDAIKDTLIASNAKDQLAENARYCDQLVARPVLLPSANRPTDGTVLTPEQNDLYKKLECYDILAENAETLKQRYETQACFGQCASTIRFFNSFIAGAKKAVSEERKKYVGGIQGNLLNPVISIADWFMGPKAVADVKFWFNILQYIYINALNAIAFLSVLTLPIAIAFAIVPNSPVNTLYIWLSILFGTFLAELYYVILIGLSATIISNTTTSYFSDIMAALIFGLAAPIASGYLAKLNAAGAVVGISSAVSQAVSAFPVIGGIFGSAARLRR